MTVPSLALVVLGKSDAEIAAFLKGNLTAVCGVDELILISNPKKRFGGYGQIANRILARTPCDVFGMVHADTAFEVEAIRTFTLEAHGGAVAGMVGRTLDSQYVWSKDGVRTEVSTLDCCSIFFPTSKGLAFDVATFDDFHCAVEDVCLLARVHHKMPVVVPAAMCSHRGQPFAGEWAARYLYYRAKLIAKWSFAGPIETT